MADAPGHLLGQIIGNVLEDSIEPLIREIAAAHDLYFDKKGPRPSRSGVKMTWMDGLGNKHDLDFVLERGGSPEEVGKPAAFIESAWRRYTKHSRAKAQEIQGALLPLLLHYSNVKPFAGAVVAGNWTKGALQQMRSSGFSVLHIGYQEIVEAFASFGIDVDADETTPDDHLREQVDAYRQLSVEEREQLAERLVSSASEEYMRFAAELKDALTRKVVRVVVLPLSGSAMEFAKLEDAITAVADFNTSQQKPNAFVRFEIQLTYSNGDAISAAFQDRKDAIDFMRTFA